MKKAPEKGSDEMRPEYDLSKLRGGVRGKYYAQAATGTNVVLIDPDLSDAFPDAKSVNDALRALVAIANRSKATKRPKVFHAG